MRYDKLYSVILVKQEIIAMKNYWNNRHFYGDALSSNGKTRYQLKFENLPIIFTDSLCQKKEHTCF